MAPIDSKDIVRLPPPNKNFVRTDCDDRSSGGNAAPDEIRNTVKKDIDV